jgi:SAM-dependent methyltransferase
MLYTYGLRLGLPLLRDRRWIRALRYLVVPVNYWRNLEYRLVHDRAGVQRGDRVLDVGSPKLLALYLAETTGAELVATDIEDYFVSEYTLLRAARGIPPERLRLAVMDGRRMDFPDGRFDKVYALSVVEHIPDDGDTRCVQEMARVLAEGGRCVLTVPFSPTSRTEYTTRGFYWSGSSSSDEHGRTFYQRRYSESDLFERLIRPSGLTLESLEYVGESVLARSRRELCDYLPPPTGPIQPLLSALVHTRPVTSWRELRKPLCALVVLTRDRTDAACA